MPMWFFFFFFLSSYSNKNSTEWTHFTSDRCSPVNFSENLLVPQRFVKQHRLRREATNALLLCCSLLQEMSAALKGGLSGSLENVILGLMKNTAEYDAFELRASMKVRFGPSRIELSRGLFVGHLTKENKNDSACNISKTCVTYHVTHMTVKVLLCYFIWLTGVFFL